MYRKFSLLLATALLALSLFAASNAFAVDTLVKGTALAGTSSSEHPARYMKDGSTTTYWAASTTAVPQTMTTDLGSPQNLTASDVSWKVKGATFNAKDYGATGNGTTDDSAAIQRAVSASALAGGGTVYLPAGTYNLIAGHTIGGDLHCNISLTSGVSLRGDGIGRTVLVGNGTTSANVVGAVHASGFTVSDLTIRADVSRRNATMQDAIKYEACRDVRIERVDVQNLYMAIAVYGCQQVTMRDCTGSYNTIAFSVMDISLGTTIYIGTSDVTVTNCTAINNYSHGFRFVGLDKDHRASGFTVSGCTAADNGKDGFLVNYLTGTRISSSTATRNGVNGFELCGTTGVTIDRSTATGQANAYCAGFMVDGDAAVFGATSGNTVSNSVASGNSYGYREWQGGAGNTVTGNNFTDNSSNPVYAAGTTSTGNTPL